MNANTRPQYPIQRQQLNPKPDVPDELVSCPDVVSEPFVVTVVSDFPVWQ